MESCGVSSDGDLLMMAWLISIAASHHALCHAPKNLAMALAVEAGELMEHFQWLSEAQSENLDPQLLETVGF